MNPVGTHHIGNQNKGDIAKKAIGERIKWQKSKIGFSIASRGVEMLASLYL